MPKTQDVVKIELLESILEELRKLNQSLNKEKEKSDD